ncbi:MAG TPA: hypothetical protein VIJ82_07155 [Streptosporangiaceae bacterium]
MEDDNGARWPGQPDEPAAEEFEPGEPVAGEPVTGEPGYPASALGGARPGRPDAGQDRLLVVPRPETGESRVDAALSLLDDLTELPVTEHPAVFERVHAELGEILGELRSGPLAGPAGRDGN